MADPQEPLFLERETYRLRRLIDAARFLPFLGAALFIVPALWGGVQRTSAGLLYLFGVWIVLIVVAAHLARRLRPTRTDDRAADPEHQG